MKLASGAVRSRVSKASLKAESDKIRNAARRKRLEQDIAIGVGLEAFVSATCDIIEQQESCFQKFWEVMQSLQEEWLNAEEASLICTHVWALKVGLDAITQPSLKQLRRALKKIKETIGELRDCLQHDEYQAWDRAWIEKEYYERKLKRMRADLLKSAQAGKSLSAEQMKWLQRNEDKTTRAQEAYESFQSLAHAYKDVKVCLKETLRDVVRTVTCGWFISVGATVCQAVHHAESAHQADERSRSPEPRREKELLTLTDAADVEASSTEASNHEPVQAVDWSFPSGFGNIDMSEAMTSYDPCDPFQADWQGDSEEELSGDESPSEFCQDSRKAATFGGESTSSNLSHREDDSWPSFQWPSSVGKSLPPDETSFSNLPVHTGWGAFGGTQQSWMSSPVSANLPAQPPIANMELAKSLGCPTTTPNYNDFSPWQPQASSFFKENPWSNELSVNVNASTLPARRNPWDRARESVPKAAVFQKATDPWSTAIPAVTSSQSDPRSPQRPTGGNWK